MYDICIIWKWIVGDFLIKKFSKTNFNICVISWVFDKKVENAHFYNIYDYIDNISIWKQKATWNITFPLIHELKDLWFWVDDFLSFKENILKELWWINFKDYKHQNIDIIKKIFSNKFDSDFEYFISARNRIEESEINDRWDYDKYWQTNKTFFDIAPKRENISYIEWLVKKINEKYGICEVFYSKNNQNFKINCKKIIFANHTPSILEILFNSKDFLEDKIEYNLIWKWFMEHPQLSFGFLINWDDNFIRNIPTTQLYKDIYIEWSDIKYRIEFHTAPPIEEKINRYIEKYGDKKIFDKKFFRIALLMEQRPSLKNSLKFFNWQLVVNENFKQEILDMAKIIKKDFLEKISKINWIKLLHNDSLIWFSWHLMWWLQFLSNDKIYKIWELKNTYIASSAMFKVWWLFNPTFTILYIANLIVEDIISEFNS